MISSRLLGAVVVSATVLWPASVDACVCAPSGLPCDATGRAEAVFVGHVVSIDIWKTLISFFVPQSRRVELAVIEAFGGLQLSQVTLVQSGSDCDYPFRMGESYVVYAYRSSDGQLATSICARTRPVADATDDLTYLRSLATIAPGTPARVAGRVQTGTQREGVRPLPGVVVTATGEGRTVSARTDARGEFELTGLALGKHEILATAPAGYQSIARTVDLHDPRGCGVTTLFVRYDGRMTGRVVDGRGSGVGGLPIELMRRSDLVRTDVRDDRVQAWTASDGTFELSLVPPGEYILGLEVIRNWRTEIARARGFYPGVTEADAAETIAISAGERVRLRDFVIPDAIRLVTVNGMVVDESSRPVREALIYLRNTGKEPDVLGPRFVTGEDGRFAFSLVADGKYEVYVTRDVGADARTRETQTAVVPLIASPTSPVLTVMLKPNRR
jgi:carboxypeptidase family protein